MPPIKILQELIDLPAYVVYDLLEAYFTTQMRAPGTARWTILEELSHALANLGPLPCGNRIRLVVVEE